MFCDLCISCNSFNGNTNPDFLEIFPDEDSKVKLLPYQLLEEEETQRRKEASLI